MASSSLQQEKGNGDETGNIMLKKGTWSAEEDELLVEYVNSYGARKWDSIRKKTKLVRDGKSCRLRWLNHLKPTLNKCSFSEEEARKVFHLYNELGPKWSQMVSQFPGRTDNELKNYINSRKRSLKNSKKHLLPENIHHVNELKDNVDPVISMMRISSNQPNNASQEEEIAPPRVELDLQDILDQISDEKNINFEPLSSYNMFCDQDFSPIPQCSYIQNMDYQLSPKKFFDQYPQNPILPFQEIQSKMLEPNSPRSNGYLEAILYPPNPNPIPPFQEIQYKMLEPNSPRSNGYLEAILYPPKIL